MPVVTLRNLYVAELQDLLDAEQHTLLELPALAAVATSTGLRELLDEHLQQTRVHTERLELLLRKLGAPVGGAPCDAMHGLIKEGRRRIGACERGAVLDAALVGIVQRIEHYEIAAYGCARTYARTLGEHEGELLLQQTLDEEGAADARLSKLAERGINQDAGQGEPREAPDRGRLRYVPASHLRDFDYRAFRVRNDADDDLGSIDGLIVDTRSDRPAYFVIDSGGWFVGQRFLVPIDALRPDIATRTLRTQLDRKAFATHPPFDADAFQSARTETDSLSYDEYHPPTWLMTGVWMTEASGFASVPPRAESDLQAAADREPPADESDPQTELTIARSEPEGRAEEALRGREAPANDDKERADRRLRNADRE